VGPGFSLPLRENTGGGGPAPAIDRAAAETDRIVFRTATEAAAIWQDHGAPPGGKSWLMSPKKT
jgi:hypothetical protein